MLNKDEIQEIIAKRVAQELHNGDTVTLGIGLPTKALKYLPENVKVLIQSENGVLGVGAYQTEENRDKRVVNAGGVGVTINEGGCFMDSLVTFGMMRGGHIDVTVLGALQVDGEGNLANWCIPHKFTPGMGGAMDLVVGTKKLIIAMEHTSKGVSKILSHCDLPLTVEHKVDMIITEKGVFEIRKRKLYLTEINPLSSLEDIRQNTSAEFETDIGFNVCKSA